MRNIIGQAKSAFDFYKVMQEGKILLMNLAKGETGEINSKLLGMIIVSKLQIPTALKRPKTERANVKISSCTLMSSRITLLKVA